MDQFDLVVVGAGGAGEVTAHGASRRRVSLAIIRLGVVTRSAAPRSPPCRYIHVEPQ